jgi:zinc transporter ZupT
MYSTETLTIKLSFAVAILAMTVISGWYPFSKRLRSKRGFDFPIGESFATGIFLGAGLLHLLPDASVLFTSYGYQYPTSYAIAGSTFLAFLWFEHLGREIYHHRQENNPAFSIIALIMLSIHSLFAGTALGLSDSYSIVVMLFFAIIAHKWAASFAIAVHLNKSSLDPKYAIIYFLIFAMMTPIGILVGTLLNNKVTDQSLFAPIFSALAAGTFLYLGTLHGLERGVMVKRCCNLRDFSFVIIGFTIMAIVAAYGY